MGRSGKSELRSCRCPHLTRSLYVTPCVRLGYQALGGREECDSGAIQSPKATLVTYVEQDPDFTEGTTVRDVVYSADNPLMR